VNLQIFTRRINLLLKEFILVLKIGAEFCLQQTMAGSEVSGPSCCLFSLKLIRSIEIRMARAISEGTSLISKLPAFGITESFPLSSIQPFQNSRFK
jgi:hypothetical protein